MDNELKEYLDAMEARLTAAMKAHVSGQCERVETSLLTAFHGWARPYEIRARGVSTAVSSVEQHVAGFDERLALIEERVSAIERRRAQ